jgi:hypothetical protein
MVVAMTSLFIALAGVAWAAGLAKNSVKSKQIKNGQVKTQDIAPGGVATANLADGAVTSAKIAAGVIPASGLADGAVTTPKLADGSVDSAKVLDEALGAADLAPNSVAPSELADGSVDTAALQDGAVTGAKTNEQSLDVPTAWAKITDGAGNGADPVLVDSEGVIAVNDGPSPGTNGVTCWDLANGFTPDLILAQSMSTSVPDAVITAVAPVTPGLGCVAGDEAQSQAWSDLAAGIQSADLYIAFFDLH